MRFRRDYTTIGDSGFELGPRNMNTNKINNNKNDVEMVTPTGTVNPFRKSAVTTRTPEETPIVIKEVQNAGNTSCAITKLGELISTLMSFVKQKNNVHHTIKEQVRTIKVTYDNALDELRTKVETSKQVDQGVQTSPLIAKKPTISTKRTRERSEESPIKGSEKIKKPRQNVREEESFPALTQNSVTEASTSEWKTVKRKKKVPQQRVRPNAMIISTNGESTYADILRKIKADPNLQEFGKSVKTIRRTQKGELLLEINNTNKEGVVVFNQLVGKTLGGSAEIRSKVSETLIECKDLDEVTTKEDICAAMQEQLGVSDLDVSIVKSMRKAYFGTQIAKICLPDAAAQKALKLGKLKIGWSVCRIRACNTPKCCFRCLEYGHIATSCKSSYDRSKMCRKCGELNHFAKNCTSDPRCMFCVANKETETGHIAGSRKCPVFIRALSLRNK